MSMAEYRNFETPVHHMQFCKTKLTVNWHKHPPNTESISSDKMASQKIGGAILYGHHHNNVLENNWIFNNVDPIVENCRRLFFKELNLVVLRAKRRHAKNLKQLIASWN
ncbi:hypothetical protein EJB05_16357, partial [Eragrostis curvula]